VEASKCQHWSLHCHARDTKDWHDARQSQRLIPKAPIGMKPSQETKVVAIQSVQSIQKPSQETKVVAKQSIQSIQPKDSIKCTCLLTVDACDLEQHLQGATHIRKTKQQLAEAMMPWCKFDSTFDKVKAQCDISVNGLLAKKRNELFKTIETNPVPFMKTEAFAACFKTLRTQKEKLPVHPAMKHVVATLMRQTNVSDDDEALWARFQKMQKLSDLTVDLSKM
jgi:hypothetical protein